VIREFKSGSCCIMVATDVASRGLGKDYYYFALKDKLINHTFVQMSKISNTLSTMTCPLKSKTTSTESEELPELAPVEALSHSSPRRISCSLPILSKYE
jgi:hypothetical protein